MRFKYNSIFILFLLFLVVLSSTTVLATNLNEDFDSTTVSDSVSLGVGDLDDCCGDSVSLGVGDLDDNLVSSIHQNNPKDSISMHLNEEGVYVPDDSEDTQNDNQNNSASYSSRYITGFNMKKIADICICEENVHIGKIYLKDGIYTCWVVNDDGKIVDFIGFNATTGFCIGRGGTSEDGAIVVDIAPKMLNVNYKSPNQFQSFNVGKKVTINQILAASTRFKNYVNSKKILPKTINVGSYKCSVPQFTYLMSMAIKYLKNKKKLSTKIAIKSVKVLKPTGQYINKKVKLKNYVSYAKSISNSCLNKKIAPNYLKISGKKVSFKVYTYTFAAALNYYKTKKILPKTLKIKSAYYKTITEPIVNKTGVNIYAIAKAATQVYSYIKINDNFPDFVSINDTNYTFEDFTYLMAKSISKIYKKDITNVDPIKITNFTLSSGDFINGSFKIEDLVSLANSVVSYAEENYLLPNNVSSSFGEIEADLYILEFSKILKNFDSKNSLGSYYTVCSLELNYS